MWEGRIFNTARISEAVAGLTTCLWPFRDILRFAIPRLATPEGFAKLDCRFMNTVIGMKLRVCSKNFNLFYPPGTNRPPSFRFAGQARVGLCSGQQDWVLIQFPHRLGQAH